MVIAFDRINEHAKTFIEIILKNFLAILLLWALFLSTCDISREVIKIDPKKKEIFKFGELNYSKINGDSIDKKNVEKYENDDIRFLHVKKEGGNNYFVRVTKLEFRKFLFWLMGITENIIHDFIENDSEQIGLRGIHNHANVCFLIAVFQCLFNSRNFTDYIENFNINGPVINCTKELWNLYKNSKKSIIADELIDKILI